MTDQNNVLLQSLQQQLAAAQNSGNPAAGWGNTAAAGDDLLSIEIPIKVNTPLGNLRLRVPAKTLLETSPQQLNGMLQMIANAGHELDAWQPKQDNGWGNNNVGGWNNGNSYGGNGYRNNYRRRY